VSLGPARLLGLTQGDPAGIGPEITLKAWGATRANGALFAAIGDPELYAVTARRLKIDVPVAVVSPEEAPDRFRDALPVVPAGPPACAEPGRPDPAHAASTLASIDAAVALAQAGRIAALVTNPIAKGVLYQAGFRHPGHTEYLAALAARPGERAPRPVMMLWSETLAVVPVTVHIPLAAVPGALTRDLLVETGRIVARDLRRRFGLGAPRLAVAGLDPHAGEGGAMDREEIEVIAPAVASVRTEAIAVSGPHPADTRFHPLAWTGYDAALAMYRDQALVPIKTIAFDDAVNVTLGLPFIRTSPDHGTAFDIAGEGLARPDSLLAAMRLAARLAAAEAIAEAA
jgi:4-hydroxythreonine-4-phosphate dehydrogenase